MLINPGSRLGKLLHWIFEASLVIKGLLALGEALGGMGLLLTPNIAIIKFVGWLTRHHLAQTPGEDMAVWAKHLTETFPMGLQHFIADQHFYAVYMLIHGAIKFTMVFMLAWRVVWAYPIAMLVLAAFVVYQVSEYFLHGGVVLLILTMFDTIMIVLVWREYQILKQIQADEAALDAQKLAARRAMPPETPI